MTAVSLDVLCHDMLRFRSNYTNSTQLLSLCPYVEITVEF
jgi:hypothetical protein